MLRDRSLARRLRDSLDRRRDSESDILYGTYVRPRGRAEHVVMPPGSITERIVGSSIGRVTFKPGAIVPLGRMSGEAKEFVIGKSPPGRSGASGFPLSAPQPGRIDVARITGSDPLDVETGEVDQLVTLTGFGFSPGDVMVAVVSAIDHTPDPYATIHDTTFVSATEATIEVDVDADAPTTGGGYRITIAIYRAWEVS